MATPRRAWPGGGLPGRRPAACEGEHRRAEVHPGQQSVHRLDQARVEVDERRSPLAEYDVGQQRAVPAELSSQGLQVPPYLGWHDAATRCMAVRFLTAVTRMCVPAEV
ncbi:hypothetical protein GCM10009850_042160 [Nonomuraea monospora]|uniref:Uncharacterized protein n=1 Tax=Nonomuraea monospora TaxID=568818 RepID=A0ABN3CH73_9ACTN